MDGLYQKRLQWVVGNKTGHNSWLVTNKTGQNLWLVTKMFTLGSPQ